MKNLRIPKILYITVFTLFLFGCVNYKHFAGSSVSHSESSPYIIESHFMPEFNLPPPKPSTSYNIPMNLFNRATKLGEIDQDISKALELAGYNRHSYYHVPNGFAIVTQLERIDEFGKPFTGDERWDINASNINLLKDFSLKKYFLALFKATPGYYRCIVFVVTPKIFSYSLDTMTREKAEILFNEGVNKLPESIKKIKFTSEYTVTALIYEFKKPENSKKVSIVPSRVDGKSQLENSKILASLKISPYIK